MDIRTHILESNAKVIIGETVQTIMDDQDYFMDLMECFFDEDVRICQRAAGIVNEISINAPSLILPYTKRMIVHLHKRMHNAIVRNTLRVWQNIDIPQDCQGEVFERCFQYIVDPNEAIAVRVFSMTVCSNISNDFPELKEELSLAISEALENGSAGIISRGRKVLKSLKPIILN